MRRKDREMDAAFAWDVVDRCTYAVLSVSCEDGTPYGVPVSIARRENSVYFHCAREGKKVDCLRSRPGVCLTCVAYAQADEDRLTVRYESAVAFGNAVQVLDDAEKLEALRLICLRHTPHNMAGFERSVSRGPCSAAVYRIDVGQITGKRNRI